MPTASRASAPRSAPSSPSADRVDLLCAFIKWHGLRVLAEPLAELRRPRGAAAGAHHHLHRRDRAPGPRRAGPPLRRRGAISYESDSTRLHAKAWLFHRRTGFDTAYVGSLQPVPVRPGRRSGVERPAIRGRDPDLVTKFAATFETLLADPDFVPTTLPRRRPARRGPRRPRRETAGPTRRSVARRARRPALPVPGGDPRALDAERGSTAGTATSWWPRPGRARPSSPPSTTAASATQPAATCRLLFVAHRGEILEQSLRTYREVLADGAFGELLRRRRTARAVAPRLRLRPVARSRRRPRLDPDAFDVVVDRRVPPRRGRRPTGGCSTLRRPELLGLTATPERADGGDIRASSTAGPRRARLWDALERDLLAPSTTSASPTATDLTRLEWTRGAYDVGGLDALYTGNDARARIVLRAAPRQVTASARCAPSASACRSARPLHGADLHRARARARRSPAQTPAAERRGARTTSRGAAPPASSPSTCSTRASTSPRSTPSCSSAPPRARPCSSSSSAAACAAPPASRCSRSSTSSASIASEFRFDVRYRALTGVSRAGLIPSIEAGFPFLPAGSQLVLDRSPPRRSSTTSASSCR